MLKDVTLLAGQQPSPHPSSPVKQTLAFLSASRRSRHSWLFSSLPCDGIVMIDSLSRLLPPKTKHGRDCVFRICSHLPMGHFPHVPVIPLRAAQSLRPSPSVGCTSKRYDRCQRPPRRGRFFGGGLGPASNNHTAAGTHTDAISAILPPQPLPALVLHSVVDAQRKRIRSRKARSTHAAGREPMIFHTVDREVGETERKGS